MPGYHKKYQRGTGNPKMPPKQTDYQTRAEYEAAVREYRRAMFPQVLPEKTPEQVRIDNVYGEGFVAPYDDDAPAPGPMRMVKQNQDGTGKADGKLNAGLKKLFAERPDLREKFGFGKKEAAMGLKTYQDGEGSGDRSINQDTADYFEGREARSEEARRGRMNPGQRLGEGPFSQVIQSMDSKAQGAMVPFGREFEQALADGDRWATQTQEELSKMGYSMDDVKSGNVPAHTMAQSLGGVGGKVFRSALINSGLKDKDANYLQGQLRRFGNAIEGGEIDVANMDKMMSEGGYTAEDAAFMSDAISKGGMTVEQFSSRRMGELAEGGGQRDASGSRVEGFPTANEFRLAQKKNIKRDGTYKGGYGQRNVTFGRDFYRETGQEGRPDEDFAAQEQQQDPQPDPQPQTDPMDPMQGMTPDPQPVQTPKQVIEQRPDPVVEERVIPDPKPTPTPDPQPTRPGPPPPMDLGIDTAMRSDRTGGERERATGQFANIQEQTGERLSAEELAEARRQMFQKMLGAKLNRMGRSYAKLNTMGTNNPRAMRMIRRR